MNGTRNVLYLNQFVSAVQSKGTLDLGFGRGHCIIVGSCRSERLRRRELEWREWRGAGRLIVH